MFEYTNKELDEFLVWKDKNRKLLSKLNPLDLNFTYWIATKKKY